MTKKWARAAMLAPLRPLAAPGGVLVGGIQPGLARLRVTGPDTDFDVPSALPAAVYLYGGSNPDFDLGEQASRHRWEIDVFADTPEDLDDVTDQVESAYLEDCTWDVTLDAEAVVPDGGGYVQRITLTERG